MLHLGKRNTADNRTHIHTNGNETHQHSAGRDGAVTLNQKGIHVPYTEKENNTSIATKQEQQSSAPSLPYSLQTENNENLLDATLTTKGSKLLGADWLLPLLYVWPSNSHTKQHKHQSITRAELTWTYRSCFPLMLLECVSALLCISTTSKLGTALLWVSLWPSEMLAV